MRMILCATLLAAGFAIANMPGVNAAPLSGAAVGQASEQLDSTVVVRDNCGRHRRWSHRRNRCVRD